MAPSDQPSSRSCTQGHRKARAQGAPPRDRTPQPRGNGAPRRDRTPQPRRTGSTPARQDSQPRRKGSTGPARQDSQPRRGRGAPREDRTPQPREGREHRETGLAREWCQKGERGFGQTESLSPSELLRSGLNLSKGGPINLVREASRIMETKTGVNMMMDITEGWQSWHRL